MKAPISLALNTGVTIRKTTKERLKKRKQLPEPAFYTHNPNLKEIERVCRPYQKYKNMIVIANGGSRTSGLAYVRALEAYRSNNKTIEFLSTMDPAEIARLKKHYKPKDTLVIPISKSGTNVDVLEPLTAFWDRYPVLAVTGEADSVLLDVAEHKGWDILAHPPVGGRYSGRTTSTYAVAHLAGLPIHEIERGAKDAYKWFHTNIPFSENAAMQAAAHTYELDRKGYTEIFTPIYSSAYAHFLPLMVQLIHESTGKKGKGQTIYGDLAPESQHHTNQRFFGGRQNVMGLFIVNEAAFADETLTTRIPKSLQSLPLRDGTLGDLHGIPFGKALQFDYEGTRDNATEHGIPHLTIRLKDASPRTAGALLSFFHEFTVYSAHLRGINPYDQPEVEGAKSRSFEKRKQF